MLDWTGCCHEPPTPCLDTLRTTNTDSKDMRMAVTTVPAYEALVQDIKAQGVDTFFSLMSDDTALFCTSLDAAGIKMRAARHENNALSMAEGYAAATGRMSLAVIGRGPATANGLHGAVYAVRSKSPVLMIFGEASFSPAPGGGGVGPDTKGLNAPGVLEAAGIRTFVATDPRTARRTLSLAMAAAQYGAVALLLPMNVQFGPVEFDGKPLPPDPRGNRSVPKQARPAAVEAAASVLRKSRRPLIIAGLGACQAGAKDAIVHLADKLGAGLATTLKAKDMFRGHPFDLGIVGSFSHAAGRRVIDQADCVMVFGAGLNQRTTSFGTSVPPDVPLIHIDNVRSNIGRWFHADVAIVADARLAAEALLEAVPKRAAEDQPLRSEEIRHMLARFDIATEFQPQHTARTIDPRTLVMELDKLLPPDRNTIYDSGNFLQVIPYLPVNGPAHWKSGSDFSSIGMGFGTALGYACGTPDRTTAFLVGDGSFLMNLGELETVVREDIPLVIVVMNDCAYGAELHYLKMREASPAMSVFPDIDFAPVAEAFGFETATVRSVEDVRALAPLLSKPRGPVLIDCKITASIAAPFLLESIEHERRKV